MLNKVIAYSLQNRLLITALSLIVVLYGSYVMTELRVDVLPDLNRPTVTIMTEAPGLAPEEVEILVTFPIESMMNGATNVRRVRSASGIGLSIVWVEFDWETDIYIDRQIVAERLQLAREKLSEGINPVMAPISSIMGEILLVGITSVDGATSPMDIRTLAEWAIRPQILAVQGVSQVTVLGGGLKQYQVITSPEKLMLYGVTLDELVEAVEAANVSAGGGFVLESRKEYLIRLLGRIESLDELENAVVKPTSSGAILVKHVADVRFGVSVKRGDGSVNGEPAVIMAIQKQPGTNTLQLTEEVDNILGDIQATLPEDLIIHKEIFRQEEFIRSAIENVIEALRDGAVLVIIILFLFLWNFRTSIINLTAIPLSIVITALVFHAFDITINTMTLGGIAVAIGELVDDAIVGVENVFRRLRENRAKDNPEPPLVVVYKASAEVRGSVVYATLIVSVVVVPLLSLGGVEGRMFAPVGYAYILSLMASLVVSLTITPVLSFYLLPKAKIMDSEDDSFVLKWFKKWNEKALRIVFLRPLAYVGGFSAMLVVSLIAYAFMGGEFLPPFNEGTFTVNIVAPPGTSLQESNRLGNIAEGIIAKTPEVISTARRTGRAELDEHAENVNYSEIDVRLSESDRSHQEVMAELRERLAYIPGVLVNVGQPISHRIDHLLSGVRAQIAVKIFGPDLATLRRKAQELYDMMTEIEGVVDIQVEQQVDIPQIKIRFDYHEIQRYGLTKKEVVEVLETALRGRVASQVLEDQRIFDLVVWFDEESRNDPEVIGRTLIKAPDGTLVPLATFAEVVKTAGPNTINRENVARRIVVSCNVQDRDLAGVIYDIQELEETLQLPESYWIIYGGQFEAQQAAVKQLYILSLFALLAVFVLLMKALGSWRGALLCLSNLPLAFVGAVLAIYIFSHGILSVASLIGFLTLTGIVMRNGILLITHYQHLIKYEGETFGEHVIIRGTMERLAPVMMTAFTTSLGLIPLALGAGDTGKEILHPLAITIIGGLVSATVLVQLVFPSLILKFGEKAIVLPGADDELDEEHLHVPPKLYAMAKRLEQKEQQDNTRR